MNENTGKILSNKQTGSDYYQLDLELKRPIKQVKPGQFCMLSVGDSSKVLRRPFGLLKQSAPRKISILYKLIGEGTSFLSKQKKRTELSILLPLGNGYPVSSYADKILYIAGGGVGLASVFPLLNTKAKKIKFFYGSKTSSEIYKFKRNPKIDYFISTDDGSFGIKGSINIAIEKELKKDIQNHGGQKIAIAACGPKGMMKDLKRRVQSVTEESLFHLSLEERMACGVGVCMGCVIRTEEGLKCSCKDGPVFEADKVIF